MSKPTDADVMGGFNPDYHASAEEIEARQAEGAPSPEKPEGDTEREAASPATEEREVTLDGKTFKAPRDVAEAFTREINRRDGTRGAELQTLRERLSRLETAPTKPTETQQVAEGPQLPDPELQIENPAEYQRQLIAHVEWNQEKRATALANRYEEAEAAKDRENGRRATWQTHVDTFYKNPEHRHLAENRDIVDLVLEQNREKLAPLSVEDGFKELARLATERIAKLTGVAPEVKGRTTPRPAVLEGSSRRGATPTPAAKTEGPRSLTEAIKERRRNAQEAFQKGGRGPGAQAQR